MSLPITFCTTDDVKSRLLLPLVSNPSQDAVIQALRDAVDERILALTGYAFDDGTNVKVETHADVQLGIPRVMRYRPILPMSVDPLRTVRLRARSLASGTFSDIIGDIKDPRGGRILPLASELTPIFPPVGAIAPWFKWRQTIWPVVEFTYQVDPLGTNSNPLPKVLVTAAIEWVAAAYSRPAGGGVKSITLERVSETYIDEAEPAIVKMLLGRHLRDVVRIVF